MLLPDCSNMTFIVNDIKMTHSTVTLYQHINSRKQKENDNTASKNFFHEVTHNFDDKIQWSPVFFVVLIQKHPRYNA